MSVTNNAVVVFIKVHSYAFSLPVPGGENALLSRTMGDHQAK